MIDKLKAYLRLANVDFNESKEDKIHLFFTVYDLRYMAEYDSAQDPTYFRIMLPMIDEVPNENGAKIQQIAMDVTSKYKVGKIIQLGNYLWVAVDNFIYGDWDFNPMFARDIAVARDMINEYKRMRNEQDKQH